MDREISGVTPEFNAGPAANVRCGASDLQEGVTPLKPEPHGNGFAHSPIPGPAPESPGFHTHTVENPQ